MAVNAAGNYTKPSMRKRLYKSILSRSSHWTAAGKWSARKAQLGPGAGLIRTNAQPSTQLKDVGPAEVAHKKWQKKQRHGRAIFARGGDKICLIC